MDSPNKDVKVYFQVSIFAFLYFILAIPVQAQNDFKLGYISGYEVVYKTDDSGNWISFDDELKKKKGTFFKPVGEIFIDNKFYTLSVVRNGKFVYWKPVEKNIRNRKKIRFIPYFISSNKLNEFYVLFYPDLRGLVWRIR